MRRLFSFRAAFAWLLMSGALAQGYGCHTPGDPVYRYRTGDRAVVGGGGAGGGSEDAEAFFEAEVKEGLIASCSGADCHASGARAFLLAGQEYAAIRSYITSVGGSLIVDPPEQSMLMTYPDAPDHAGRGWTDLEPLKAATLKWLQLEAANISTERVIQIGPFDPSGLTTIPLDALGDDFKGTKLAFYAATKGSANQVLELTGISFWPRAGTGLRVLDPTFVVLSADGSETNYETFHGDSKVFVAPSKVTLGDLLVTKWREGDRMVVRFGELEFLYADDAGDTFPRCLHVDLFAAAVDVLPLRTGASDPNGLLYCADQCHGGKKGAEPTAVMNLAELLSAPRDNAFACAKTLPFIIPADLPKSQIITSTAPDNTVHPFVFGGSTSAHDAFKTAMKLWIDGEGAASP